MANVWFTSDLHWGHKNICKYRDGFSSELEHRLTLKENILTALGKRDILWVLGDSVFTDDALPDLYDIKNTKFLVIGNHCGQHMKNPWDLYHAFDRVYGIHSKYGSWLTHAPIHDSELRGRFNVHGHTHGTCVDDPRYLNVCPEQHDYKPIDLNMVREILYSRNGGAKTV